MNMAMMIPPRTKNTRHGYISLPKDIFSCVTRGNSLIASCLELVDSCVDLLLFVIINQSQTGIGALPPFDF